MKTYFLATAIAFSTFMVSCNNDKNEATDPSLTTEPATSTPEIMPSTSGDSLASTPNIILPDSLITNPAIQSKMQPANATTPSQITPAPSGKGLNPAHGQPGHRCDIAVGAPLSADPAAKPSAPVTTPVAAPTSSPAPMQITPSASTTPSIPSAPGAKLNPAHGQPGHDCAIAVGAPLKN